MTMITVCAMLFTVAAQGLPAQAPTLSEADRVRLAEAFRIGRALGDDVGPGATETPFAVLLVAPDQEFLIGHPRPSPDFRAVGRDSLLQADVYVRPRSFATGLLATFPAVGGVSTIVMGQPEQTGRSSTFWVLTVLHERFHQIQTSQGGYYDAVNALDLAGNDRSGGWMLNYAFPYDSSGVAERFDRYRAALRAGLAARSPAQVDSVVRSVLAARAALRDVLRAPDWRYLEFQLWQEGIARYTEIRVARAVRELQPLPSFAALPDFIPYAIAADSLRRNVERELGSLELSRSKRVSFYAAGAAEGLLLDEYNPTWRTRYFAERFALEPLYKR